MQVPERLSEDEMSKERELLRQSLIALEDAHIRGEAFQDEDARLSVIEQITELLTQPEQAPVAWIIGDDIFYSYQERGVPLYTSPPKREPMTGKEISQGFRTDKDNHYGVKINEAL